jgi:hypothetical protein
LREVHESLLRRKDIILMREVAEMHGGGILDIVFNEIDQNKSLWTKLHNAHGHKGTAIDLRKALFDEDRGDVVLWHRVLEFKRVALKMLITRVLQQQGVEHTGLSIPGELSLQRLDIPALTPQQKYHICLPQHDSSSRQVESKLRGVLQSMNMTKSFRRRKSSTLSAKAGDSGHFSSKGVAELVRGAYCQVSRPADQDWHLRRRKLPA